MEADNNDNGHPEELLGYERTERMLSPGAFRHLIGRDPEVSPIPTDAGSWVAEFAGVGDVLRWRFYRDPGATDAI